MSHARRDKQNGASGRQRQVANDDSSPQRRRRPDLEERHFSIKACKLSANRKIRAGYGSYAKFPMVEMDVSWPGYSPVVIERFRGWDIRRYSGVWQMSPVSGTGA